MKHITIALFLVVGTLSRVQARVGETYDELVKRYGASVADRHNEDLGQPFWIFHYKQLQIEVDMLKDRSACETYKAMGQQTGDFSQEAIDVILGANSRGKRWKPVESIDAFGKTLVATPPEGGPFIGFWLLEEDSLISVNARGPRSGEIMVFSKEWSDYAGAQMQKEQRKKIDDSGL